MKILRKGLEQAVHVNVAELKAERVAASSSIIEESPGLTVQEITSEIARSLWVADAKGLVVTNVEEGSPPEEAGVRRGDMIVEVNRPKGETLRDYRAALGCVGSTDSLPVLLVRPEGNVLYVALKMAK